MFGAESGTVEVDGLELSTLSWGPKGGPVVLCLHGWLDNVASFAPLAQQLHGYRVIAVDMPGHGASQHRPPGSAYHQLDWIINVSAIISHLGIERFVLMGHSMGAGIAALTTGTYPELVSGLVLLEGIGPRPTSAADIPAALREHCEIKKRELARRVLHRGAPFEIAVRARLAFGDPIERRSVKLLCERGVTEAPGGVVFSSDRRLQLAQPLQLTEDQISAFYARIACPTLLVMGENGLRYRAGIVETRKQAIADFREVTYPGGHHVHMDDAATVALSVQSFLDGIFQ